METICNGLVIKSVDFQDNDQIITILTKEHGLITLMCAGTRKEISKNRHATNVLDFSEFEFFKAREHGKVSRLKKASLLKKYENITANVELYSYATYFGEMISFILESEYNYGELANLYLSAISALEKKVNPELVFVKFELELLKLTGNKVYLEGCAICRTRKEILAISPFHNGLVCYHCAEKGKTKPNDKEQILDIIRVNNASFDELNALNISGFSKVYLVKLMHAWVKDLFPLDSKALELISYLQSYVN